MPGSDVTGANRGVRLGGRMVLGFRARDFAIAAAYMLRPFWPDLGKTWPARTELETRRKRLLYRSVYRGNKENDILLGQFARAHIADVRRRRARPV